MYNIGRSSGLDVRELSSKNQNVKFHVNLVTRVILIFMTSLVYHNIGNIELLRKGVFIVMEHTSIWISHTVPQINVTTLLLLQMEGGVKKHEVFI